MEFPASLTRPNVGNTFCGVPISQTWNDLCLWEEFLNRTELRSFVELGTWRGGMAVMLSMQALARGFKVVTVDRESPEASLDLITRLGGSFLQCDVFAEDGSELLNSQLCSLSHLFCFYAITATSLVSLLCLLLS